MQLLVLQRECYSIASLNAAGIRTYCYNSLYQGPRHLVVTTCTDQLNMHSADCCQCAGYSTLSFVGSFLPSFVPCHFSGISSWFHSSDLL